MAANPFNPRNKKQSPARKEPSVSPHALGLVAPLVVKPLVRIPRGIKVVPRKRPVPFPMFPRSPAIKPPFGTKPGRVFPAVLPGITGKSVGRFLPYIGPAMMAGGFLGAWLSSGGDYDFPAGWIKCWDIGGPKQAMSGPTLAFGGTCSTSALDYRLGGQVPSGVYGDDIAVTTTGEMSIWFGPYTNPELSRMLYAEKWRHPASTGTYIIPFAPTFEPHFIPSEWPLLPPQWLWPWIDPLAPETLPVAPSIHPFGDPLPELPFPHPDPLGPVINPEPTTDTTVPTWPAIIPAVSFGGIDGPIRPYPDGHAVEPPGKNEREKKKRLASWQTYPWLKVLEKGLGTYMELDDVVAALYKGLDWRVRRWRGRDGVWRDRDITTADRLHRMYNELGKLDVQKAVTEVIKNELTDQAFGSVGNALKRRAKELGEKGLYTGSGFQTGGSRLRKTWDEAYKMLQEQQAQYLRSHPGYYWSFDKKAGIWKKVARPVTQIPWFRRESGLTGRSYYVNR